MALEKALNSALRGRTYKCIKKWKYNHFDIGDEIYIRSIKISNKPNFSDKTPAQGLEISLDITFKDYLESKNGMTNWYATLEDWQYFLSCMKQIWINCSLYIMEQKYE